jgi:hypothetical protein
MNCCHIRDTFCEFHTVDVRTRREGGIPRQCLGNVAVGTIDIMIFLATCELMSLQTSFVFISLLAQLQKQRPRWSALLGEIRTLVRTLYSQLRTCWCTGMVIYYQQALPCGNGRESGCARSFGRLTSESGRNGRRLESSGREEAVLELRISGRDSCRWSGARSTVTQQRHSVG